MDFDLPSAFAGLAKAIAVATIVGGGTMVLSAHKDNAVQSTQIDQLSRTQQSLDSTLSSLDKSVRDLEKGVAVLNERIGNHEQSK